MLLAQLQEIGIQLSKDQLAILVDLGEIINFGLGAFTVTTNALFQADGVEVYDSDCDDVPNAQPSFMAIISGYGSDVLAEVNNQDNMDNNMINQAVQAMSSSKQSSVVNHSETEITSDSNIIPYSHVNDTLTAELKRYKEQVKVLKEGQNIDLKSKDNVSDSCEQSVEIDRLKQTLSEHLKEKESLMQTVTLLKNDFKKEESRNIDREIALEKKIKYAIVIPDSEETLMLAEEIRSKMLLKQQDPMMLEKKVNTTPVDYNSMNSSDLTLSSRPIKVEVPKKLPKVSMVNTSLKKLKHHIDGFDMVVKERTMATTITEGYKDIVNIIVNSSVDNAYVNVNECEKCLKLETELLNKKDFIEKEIYDKLFRSYTTLEKHCISLEVDTQLNQEIFQRDNSISNQSALSFDQYFELNEMKAQSQEKDTVIKRLKERIKSLSGNMNEDKIQKDIDEIETINIELDHRVSKLIAENEHLKQTYKKLYDSIKPTRVRSKEQCDALVNQVNQKSVEISDLNASLQEKVLVIIALKNELRKLKGKSVIACRESVNKPKVIAPVVHKVDLEPLSLKLKNNREAHVDYIRITKENAVTLRDIVEQARTSNPLDNALAYACMYTKQIQELLVYVIDTCPSSPLKSEKLVAITPMNNAKKVTFAKTSTTSDNNTQIQVDVHQTQTTNKPSVPSTNVKCSTNASRSKPRSETKNNRIMQPLSSNQKYQKVEAHTRNAKPSLTNENSESKFVCLTCNKCYFDARHDFCVVQHLSEVNVRARAKAVKSIKMKEWKPTGKMFKNVGYKCVPTGRTFTIVGTKCPLTRFTSTKIVPPRKPVKSTVITNIKPSSSSQWRPKETNHASSSSAPKIVESKTANHLEPNNHMGSNVSISTCSSSVQCSLGLDLHFMTSKYFSLGLDLHFKTSKLYTLRLLDAACKKGLNLLKKGLLIYGEAKTTSYKRLRGRPTAATKNHMILSYDNRRDLPRNIPLDSVVILRYEKRSKSENKGKVPTEMELVLEQTQQGTSYEVSVDPHGFEGYLKMEVKSKEEHEVHLKLVLELLKKEKLFVKFSKCEFWLQEVHFLGHMVNSNGIYVDHSKIEAVKNWKKNQNEIRYHPRKENVVADVLSRKERVLGSEILMITKLNMQD
ncbi:hypothetical protein Tco_0361083 [Tanacetum coccineum]